MPASRSVRFFAAHSALQERRHIQEPRAGTGILSRDALRRAGPSLLVLAGYLLLSAALFGRAALTHLHSDVVGFGPQPAYYGRDQSAYVWFLDWGAHAIARLHNPLATSAIFAPYGFNLAWAASIQGPALVMAPFTLLAGPIVAFNLLAIAAPATSAWGAYLLCRRLTSVTRSSAVAGGLLFGFGTYETVEMVNHVNLALVALVPLAALLAIVRATGAISRRRYVICLALLLTAQLWTSTEVLASMVIFGALAFALATLLGGSERRRAILATAAESVMALPFTAILGSPFLYHAFRYPNPVQHLSGATSGADVANIFAPTAATWLPEIGRLGQSTTITSGNLTEQLAFLGIPVLVLMIAFAVAFGGTLRGRLLTSFFLLVLIASLGGHLIVDGNVEGLALPWSLFESLPLMNLVMADRFAVYLWLAIAIATALWLDRPTRRQARWGLLAVVVASLIPSLATSWATRVDAPSLMRSPQLARYVPTGSTVLALPFGISGDSMFWQVEAGFAFNLAGGYVSIAVPSGYLPNLHLIQALSGNSYTGDATPNLCNFLRRTSAATILLREHTTGPWSQLLGPLHIAPTRVGGFYVYALRPVFAPDGACETAPRRASQRSDPRPSVARLVAPPVI